MCSVRTRQIDRLFDMTGALVQKWRWLQHQPAYRRAPLRVLLRLLAWRMRCWAGRPAVVALPTFGVQLWLPPQWRGVAKLIYAFREDYELELRYLWNGLQPGDAMVDVGASFGIYSLAAASRVGPAGCVLAFEAARAAYESLCRNVELNGCAWLYPFHLALADRRGTATLYHHADPSRNSLAPNAGRSQEQVPVATLDEVLDTIDIPNRITTVKIDVEGAEALVLQGAQQTIARFRPVIVVEMNPSAAQRLGIDANAAWRLLEDCGYRFYAVAEDGSIRQLTTPPPGGNVLALPHERNVR